MKGKIGQEIVIKDLNGCFPHHPDRKLPKKHTRYNISKEPPLLDKTYKIIGTQTLHYPKDRSDKCIIVVRKGCNNAHWISVEQNPILDILK